MRPRGLCLFLLVAACKRAPVPAVSDDVGTTVSSVAPDVGPEDGLATELAALEALVDATPDTDGAPAIRGDVEIGTPKAVDGELPDGADRSLRAARFRLRRCLVHRSAATASYVATLVVKEGGEVSTVTLVSKSDAGAAAALESCLVAALETVRFESPDAGLARVSVAVEVR